MIYGKNGIPIIKYVLSGTTKIINFNLPINGVHPAVKVEYVFNDPDIIEHVSVFTGRKKTIIKGYRTRITMHLINMTSYMWDTSSLKDLAQMNACWITDDLVANQYIEFNVLKVSPYYYDNVEFLDACVIELETRDWYNVQS